MLNRLRYRLRLLTRRPARYRNLLLEVYRSRARNILEIGVYNGRNARHMIETAAIFRPPAEIGYHGFDLFELLTPEILEKEFSKQPLTEAQVHRKLAATGARVTLTKGFTQETLPAFLERNAGPDREQFDLVFIDGGHASETIASDWSHVRELMGPRTTVLFDDYYLNDPKDVAGVGCRSLIDALDRSAYEVAILEPEDRFAKDWGTLRVRMARVRLR